MNYIINSSNNSAENVSSEIFTNKRKHNKHVRSRSYSNLLNLIHPKATDDLYMSVWKSDQNIQSSSSNTRNKNTSDVIITVVLIEAKDLLLAPENNCSRVIYCKFRLGTESFKSKSVAINFKPEWKERFTFSNITENVIEITLWDKGKEKQFVGSCFVDVSQFEKDRTHNVWQKLDHARGSVHLSVTICSSNITNVEDCAENKLEEMKWTSNGNLVGQLHVTVHEARGLPVTALNGKISAYCMLELDNEQVRTPKACAYNTLHWNKSYTFNIYDITSTLIFKVYNEAILNTFKDENLGRVYIPLLKVQHGEKRWYALKDKSRRNHAKGNCPRVLLEMSISWDAVRACSRLFTPQEVKYNKKPPKFNLILVYNNLLFVRNTFNALYQLNGYIKEFLEWEDRKQCRRALFVYLVVCYFFRLWMIPLLLLVPFIIQYLADGGTYKIRIEENLDMNFEYIENVERNDKSFTGRIQDLHGMTLTITDGIEYLALVGVRLYNLTNNSVPFLTYTTILLLIISTFGLYYIPFNYLLMGLGIYKYARKLINPNRILNNDILDFLSRVPDKSTLSDWKELDVPEYPNVNSEANQAKNFSIKYNLKELQQGNNKDFKVRLVGNVRSH